MGQEGARVVVSCMCLGPSHSFRQLDNWIRKYWIREHMVVGATLPSARRKLRSSGLIQLVEQNCENHNLPQKCENLTIENLQELQAAADAGSYLRVSHKQRRR